MAVETVNIADFDRNGLQTRVALDEETVKDYAEAMTKRAKFPPVTAFCDGTRIYLADGFHRVEAALRCGYSKIKADVSPGSYVEALRFALGANANHGLRRTNADKRRSLEMAWEHRMELFGGEPSNALLAEMCGVSDRTVFRFREEAAKVAPPPSKPPTKKSASKEPAKPKPPTQRIGKDGKTRTVPQSAPPAPTSTQTSKAPTKRPCRNGYYIGPDGKEHAVGILLDRFNVEIPPRLNNAFGVYADWIKEWVHDCQCLKNEIAEKVRMKLPIAVSQRTVINLDAAFHELKAALPFCVCRMCQGNGCAACAERGFQTKDQYERNPKEYKA